MKNTSWKIVAPISALVVAAVSWYGVRRINARAEPPVPLGVSAGRLAECPDSPNCVATVSNDPDQQMPPLPLRGDAAQSLQAIRALVAKIPRSRLAAAEGNYLRFEVRTRWLGFVDDVEFLAVPEEEEIHFRSASRTGYSDLGVNRSRMQAIAEAYLNQ